MADENGKWLVFPLGEKGIGTAPYLIHCPPQTVVNGDKTFLLIRPALLESNFSVRAGEKEGGWSSSIV